MTTYEATFTYTSTDGIPASGIRRFTYPTLVTDQQQMVGLAEHMIGILVATRDLTITSVREVGGTIRIQPEVV